MRMRVLDPGQLMLILRIPKAVGVCGRVGFLCLMGADGRFFVCFGNGVCSSRRTLDHGFKTPSRRRRKAPWG